MIQMPSLFEQDYFVEENYLKKYPYSTTNKNIKAMVETLAQIAADPKVRRAMQEEYWAAQNEILWENQVETLTNEIGTLSSEIGTLSSEIGSLSSEIGSLSSKIGTLSNENVTLSSKNVMLSSENLKLRQLLQQAGIDISLLDKQKN